MYNRDTIYFLGLLVIIVNYAILNYKEEIKTNVLVNSILLGLIVFTLNKNLQLGILLSSTYLILNQ